MRMQHKFKSKFIWCAKPVRRDGVVARQNDLTPPSPPGEGENIEIDQHKRARKRHPATNSICATHHLNSDISLVAHIVTCFG